MISEEKKRQLRKIVAKYRKLKSDQLKRSPLCCVCGKTATVVVHTDDDEYQSFCKTCNKDRLKRK